MRDRQTGMSHQVVQQIELFGRQMNGDAALLHQPAREIESQVADRHPTWCGRAAKRHGFARSVREYGKAW